MALKWVAGVPLAPVAVLRSDKVAKTLPRWLAISMHLHSTKLLFTTSTTCLTGYTVFAHHSASKSLPYQRCINCRTRGVSKNFLNCVKIVKTTALRPILKVFFSPRTYGGHAGAPAPERSGAGAPAHVCVCMCMCACGSRCEPAQEAIKSD
jgi:hypothetical protein